MTLLAELFNYRPIETPLVEDLGALKIIDPIFKKSLLSFEKGSRYVPAPTEWNPEGTKRINTMTVNPALGKDSKIEMGPKVKSGKDVMNGVQEHGDVEGFILSDPSEPKQVMVAIRTWSNSSSRSFAKASLRRDGWNFGLDLSYMAGSMSQKDAENLDSRLKNLEKYGSYKAGSYQLFNYGVDGDKLLRVLNGVMDIMKKLPMGAQLEFITADPNRKGMQTDRKASQAGQTPDTRDFKYDKEYKTDRLVHYQNDWEKEARGALRTRLDQFKSSKTKGVATHDELPEFVGEHGWLDKLLVGGFVYDYYDSRIDIKALQGKTYSKEAYVEYKLNQNTKAYKDFEDTRPAARYDTPEYEEWRAKRPPGSLKIMLKLDGGHIVPSHVQLEERF